MEITPREIASLQAVRVGGVEDVLGAILRKHATWREPSLEMEVLEP